MPTSERRTTIYIASVRKAGAMQGELRRLRRSTLGRILRWVRAVSADLPTAIARLRALHEAATQEELAHDWHDATPWPKRIAYLEALERSAPALLAVAEAAEKLDRHAPDCGATIGGACVCQLGQVSSTLDALAKAVG